MEVYQKFDQKVKKMEFKRLGTISLKYEFKWEIVLERFMEENLVDSDMKDFIRSEYLNLIMARKKFVMDNR